MTETAKRSAPSPTLAYALSFDRRDGRKVSRGPGAGTHGAQALSREARPGEERNRGLLQHQPSKRASSSSTRRLDHSDLSEGPAGASVRRLLRPRPRTAGERKAPSSYAV